MNGTILGISPHSHFKNRTGPGLEPVGGEFQPPLETGYPGGGAHLIFGLNPVTRHNQQDTDNRELPGAADSF